MGPILSILPEISEMPPIFTVVVKKRSGNVSLHVTAIRFYADLGHRNPHERTLSEYKDFLLVPDS